MKRAGSSSYLCLVIIALVASAAVHCWPATAFARKTSALPRIVITDSGGDYLNLTVPVSYLIGSSSDEALASDATNPASFDADLGAKTIYVAVPDCDGVSVECSFNGGKDALSGGALRKPREKLVQVIAVSRLRNQSVAALSMNVEAIQRLQLENEESFQLKLRFRNPRGSISSDLGPMERSLGRLLVRERATIHGRGVSRPIVATADGQVTWAAGSNWQQAMQSAIDANTDYLMIMADELSEVLVDSLAIKRAVVNNLNVTIVKMSQIDADPDTLTTPATIRDLIKGVYDSRSAAHSSDSLLSYVVLIGDAVRPDTTTLIPSYNGFTSYYGGNEGLLGRVDASDSYYSLLSEEDAENDIFPDVFLGRLPVDAVSSSTPPDPDWELRNVKNKIWGYEPTSLPARKVLLVSGGEQTGLPKFQPYFGYLMGRLPSYVVADSLHRLDYPLDGDPIDGPKDRAFSDSVYARLNTDEYSVFAHFDHGNPFYLPQSFYAMHYDSLDTPNSLPLALLFGTDIGRFDLPAFNKAPPNAYGCLRPYSPANPWQVSIAELDSCDVLPERLVLQEYGAIGAIAMSRTTTAESAANPFTSMMRAVFEENALSLGEVLLTTRLLMYPSGSPDRNLMLFGDPALNILWENTVATSDTIDLSISASDIRPLDAVREKYVSSSSVLLAVGIRNKGTADATDVAYGVWEGPPGTGTLLASGEIAEIPGFNAIAWDTITVSGTQPGVAELFVQIDSTAYLEPTYLNNVASRKIYAYDYQPGFPIALNDRTTHSVTLADIRTDNFGDEILIQTSKALRCFDATGQSLWQVASQGMSGSADAANGTPLVANVYKNAVPYAVYLDGNQPGFAMKAYIVNGFGAKIDSVTLDSQSWFFGSNLSAHATNFVLADLVTDDDALELITVSGKYLDFSEPKHVRAYSIENHSFMWKCLIGDGALGYEQAASIASGDIDLDGSPEVLIRLSAIFGGVDSLYCIRSNGDCAWGVEGGGPAAYMPYDVTMVAATGAQSGEMKVLTTARDSSTGGAKIVEADASGTDQTIVTEAAGQQSPVFSSGDVDGDGALELVMGRDSTLAVYEADGSLTAELASDIGTMKISPLLVDVNGDGQTEVIMLSGGENKYSPYENRYVLDVMTMNLELLTRFEFPFLNKDIDKQHFGGPAIGDIDDDGIAELAFVSLDSVLHVIELGQMGRSPWPQRYGNPMQTNVTVQAVKGTYNGPVSLFNTVEIVDDAAFNGPVYVDGTATIRVADEDPTPAGFPTVDDLTVYTDIIIRDEFQSIGSEFQPVRFMSWDGSAESDDPWWSLFITDSTLNASGEFIHTEIRGALSGITARRPITLQDCLIEDCAERGLNVADAGTVAVSGSTIRGADYGINALDGTTVLLSNSIIEDCGNYGVAVYDDSRLQAIGTTFDGNGIATYLAKESGSWVKGTIRGSTYTGNAHGLWINDTGDSTVLVDDCTLENQSTTGMYLEAAKVVVDSTTIQGAQFGIRVTLETALTLSQSALEDASLYGVLGDADDTTIDVTKTSFDGNDTGLALAAGASWVRGAIRDCTFTNNGDGIWIYDVGDSSVVIDDCVIDDNTSNGIYVEEDGDVSITRNTITNNAIGVYSYGSNPSIRSRNVIQYNTGGIKCDSYSVAVAESSTVNNNTNGVVVTNGANPDLGHETGGSSLGQNIMRPNTTYHVLNFTSNDIVAQNNYWPRNPPTQCNPQSTKFYGSVDYDPHLGCVAPELSAPSSILVGAGEESEDPRLPTRFKLRQNYPNPFNPVTTIAYEVPSPGIQVEIALYDVGGRLVAVLVDEHRTPGFYSVTWNGVNRNGEPVASGVYFLRMRAGHFVDTKKLLLLK